MNPAELIPVADTIPSPWWIFETLGVVTFTLHLLLMNIVLGGTLIGTWYIFFSKKRKNESYNHLLSAYIPTSLALAVNMGVAPLLFIQVTYGHFMYTSSVLMATFWILIIPFLIIAYYAAYVVKESSKKGLVLKVSIVTSAVLLLYTAFMFTNNMTLMIRPDKWISYFNNSSGTILNLGDLALWPRYFHFLTASVAVAALFISVVQRFKTRKSDKPEHDSAYLKIFGVVTLIQAVVGIWFLLALPEKIMFSFMGRNIINTVLLLLGIGLGISAGVTAMMNKFKPTLVLFFHTILVMVLLRMLVRFGYLEKYFHPADLKLNMQNSPLVMFLLAFVAGIATIVWMLRRIFENPGKENVR